MNNAQLSYFEKDDVLHLLITEGEEASSVEIAPNVTAELNADGALIGIEILHASNFIRDAVMDSVQGKLLGLTRAPS